MAGHVIDIPVSEMVHGHPSESKIGHIMEQGTGNVDPNTPVCYCTVPVPVTWNVGSSGVGSGSLVFPIAESWTSQMAENVVPEAGSLVARRAGIIVEPVAGNVVQVTVDEAT